MSGYDVGTLLDGSRTRNAPHLYKNSRGPHGRIKLGTESNGPFQNIAIANCTFDYCRGLALESVDGAIMEDIAISNLVMRDLVNAPIFIRLGARMRGPADTTAGTARRISIRGIVATTIVPDHGILLTGVPGHVIEDMQLADIFIRSTGGGTAAQAARLVPEDAREYPEPWRFGVLPSYGLFARHVKNLSVHHVEFAPAEPEQRPAIFLQDITAARLDHITFPRTGRQRAVFLRDVRDLTLETCSELADIRSPTSFAEEKL